MDNVNIDACMHWLTDRQGYSDSYSQEPCLNTLPPISDSADMNSIVELDHDELVDEELDEILDRLDKLESVIVLLADRVDAMSEIADKLGAIAELLDTTKTE